jgi:hypothetical protein
VEHAYTQARAWCQQVGETPQLVPVLFGLWRFYVTRSQLHTARELGDTLLRLAQRVHDPAVSVIAHHALGFTGLCLGTLPTARQHLEDSIARYTPDQGRAPVFRMGQDSGVCCRAYMAWTLWLLGYPAQALAHLHEALALAHELSHPYSLAFAGCVAASVYQCYRDVPAVHAHAEAAVALSTEQGFPLWAAMGTILRGWALAPMEVIAVTSEACPCGQTELPETTPYYTHQVIELPDIQMVVKHVVLHEAQCPRCSRLLKAELPAEYRYGYGPRLTALIGVIVHVGDARNGCTPASIFWTLQRWVNADVSSHSLP